MAAPPEINIRNIGGTYTLNRTLSDPTGEILRLQNVGWLVRKAAEYSTVTIHLRQYDDPETKTPRLDQEQISTGGMKNEEVRHLDWQPRDVQNRIWGKVKGQSRYAKLTETEAQMGDAWTREGWEGEDVIEGFVESTDDDWTAYQLWGFAEVDGQRRHVRRVLLKKPGEENQRARMVYDYAGPVEESA